MWQRGGKRRTPVDQTATMSVFFDQGGSDKERGVVTGRLTLGPGASFSALLLSDKSAHGAAEHSMGCMMRCPSRLERAEVLGVEPAIAALTPGRTEPEYDAPVMTVTGT